jgi:hypothetical protein
LIGTDQHASLSEDNFEALQLLHSGFASGMVTVEEMGKLCAKHAFANDWKEAPLPDILPTFIEGVDLCRKEKSKANP